MEIVKEIIGDSKKIKMKDNMGELMFHNHSDLNGNLYFSASPNVGNNCTLMTITKNDFEIYSVFKQLFDDIKEAKIYESDPGKNDYLQVNYQRLNELANGSREHCDLYDKESNSIIWVSDDTSYDDDTSLVISESKDVIYVRLLRNGLVDFPGRIRVAINTSSSRYDHFFVPFIRAHNALEFMSTESVSFKKVNNN